MKIDFIIASLNGGGAERVMVILANKLSNLGYDIKIITFSPGLSYELDDKVTQIKLHEGKIRNHSVRRLTQLLYHYKNKGNRPNIIISFITLINLISIIVSKIYKIKVICSEHNSHLRAQRPVFLTRLTRKLFYPRADVVTVLTAFDLPYYTSLNVNTVVMPNPCTFSPITNQIHKREKNIVAVGNLDRYNHKGFDNLIDIAAQVFKSRPDWKLEIVGDGNEGMTFLKQKVAEFGLESSIIFAGFRNDIESIMSKSEIFILPSRYEGLPMVLLEAMSQGMACIAYDCKTGPADIISNNKNGILIEDQNQQEMTKALISLIDNSELRTRLSKNGIKSLKNFDIETIIGKWESLFKELCS